MPDAKNIVVNYAITPNAFLSPFSGRPPVAFYSSITIPRADGVADCVPCAVTGIYRKELAQFLQEMAIVNKPVPFVTGTTTQDTVPVIPPLPKPKDPTCPDISMSLKDESLFCFPDSNLPHDIHISGVVTLSGYPAAGRYYVELSGLWGANPVLNTLTIAAGESASFTATVPSVISGSTVSLSAKIIQLGLPIASVTTSLVTNPPCDGLDAVLSATYQWGIGEGRNAQVNLNGQYLGTLVTNETMTRHVRMNAGMNSLFAPIDPGEVLGDWGVVGITITRVNTEEVLFSNVFRFQDPPWDFEVAP